MDCAAREGIQFSDSNGVRRLPAARGSKKPTILVVDDEVASGQVLSVRLKLAGFRSSFISSGEQALRILAGNHVDAVLSDLKMPGFSGLELLTRIRRDYPSLAFLLLVGRNDAHIGAQAIKDGADDYLLKPVEAKDVLRNLRRALDRKRVEGEALELQKRLEQLVFERTAQLSSALQSAEQSYENTLLALGAALDLRDGQTADHSRRVCRYSLEIAKRMGCSEVQLKSLSQGALLRLVSQAIEEIALKTGRQFDPQVVQTFLGIPTEVLKEIHGEQKERTYARPATRSTEMETSGRIGIPVAACG